MWNKKTGIQATGEITTCLNAFHDLMMENDTYRGPYKGPMGGMVGLFRDDPSDSKWLAWVCFTDGEGPTSGHTNLFMLGYRIS